MPQCFGVLYLYQSCHIDLEVGCTIWIQASAADDDDDDDVDLFGEETEEEKKAAEERAAAKKASGKKPVGQFLVLPLQWMSLFLLIHH